MITGGSSGIGRELARSLSRRGWHCVLLARREEPLRAAAEEIGGEYEVCDVGDRASVERAAAAVLERHPAIGLLVNNAGVPGRRTFVDADPEVIEEVTRINYLGSVWCLRAFLPALEAAQPSHVVNVCSVAGVVAGGTSGPYSASKHAQVAFSRSTTAELRPRGIHVHTLLPGFTETEGFPQKKVLPKFLHFAIIGPQQVADAVVRAVEHDKSEVFVPWFYRVPAILAALLPGIVTRTGSKMRNPA